MRIGEIRTLSGPNIYNHKPVLVMKLFLDDLTETESYEIPGFIDRLLALLPGLRTHHCAKGRPGGFIERLYGGTYFGHIVEHVALELTEMAGVPAFFGKTLYADGPGLYDVVVEYRAEQTTRYLLQTAVELVDSLVSGKPFPLEERILEAKQIAAKTELGPSTRAIVDAAERRGIPWSRLNYGSLIQLGYGKHRKYVQATISDHTCAIGVDIAGDKSLTKNLLEQACIPVPRGRIVRKPQEAIDFLVNVGKPVVVKPLNGCQGKGVSLNLTTPSEVRYAFQIAVEYSSDVMVEEFLLGKNYRVLVINGHVTAVSERIPAHVVGDGKHTVAELIELTNLDPLRGDDHEKPLTRIVIDPILIAYLRKRGRNLNDIPDSGEVVYLRESANLSTGGIARDVTDKIHPDVAMLCERAARTVGLDICGVDLVLPDIAEPLEWGRGGVIEVNAAPGIRMHHYPSEGQSRNVAEAIVEMMYPAGSPSRIPIISVTGTNGKTTTTRMIGHILAATGKTIGMTTTDGIFINGRCIMKGDTTGPISAKAVLSDTLVEAAVLETARGGIVRSGLGYDWSDVGVITNIQPDHIGQDGIEQLEDILHIKSLVAERVREGGTLVLNADDERLAGLMTIPRLRKVKKNVVYFSLQPDHPLIKRYLAANGTAFFLKNDWIVEAKGQTENKIVHTCDIPITMGGTAEFHIANALAAIAACRGYGMTRERIASAISTFRSDWHNPGRTNLFQVANGYVMVDYGHNPDSFAAVSKMASLWEGRRVTGIVGVPGDRDNSVVELAARVAAKGFGRLIVKEDKDLRGRLRGEVANIMYKAIRDEVPNRECKIILDECEALSQAVREMQPGEIIVIFYEKLEPVMKVLALYGAVSVWTVEGILPRLSLAKM
ncbi:cyanophycin synthetase [Effusibacillus lacus]|uniref:Cyanophycin synthetase n=1 Tax=Effusibacillus lacus TaxID=1348429 RepID=A0A292YJW3_9BACL|nr:cyanophycin synthetase [Effusibacillus lacus]TCS74452.1 cyanophycin synthetase [Effusibacillus lacus]GAX88674.1 cyanophycin synthetase [Effusibacillus lacus]